MPKFKELREERGLQAKQVAERAGVEVTLYSRFENYRALPIPADFERIIEALNCTPNEVYSPDEVRLLPNATKVEATGGARVTADPTEYKMTVRLGNDTKALASVKTANETLANGYNEAIKVVNDLSARVAALEKNYDPTLIK